jgi:hypothetical protein
MRIGTNHGSLSARILSFYGDTPKGMVEVGRKGGREGGREGGRGGGWGGEEGLRTETFLSPSPRAERLRIC